MNEYFMGMLESRGHFGISLVRTNRWETGWDAELSFLLPHEDIRLLMKVKDFLEEQGIYLTLTETPALRLTELSEALKFIDFLEKQEWHSIKFIDFTIWKMAATKIRRQEHLSAKGIVEIAKMHYHLTGRREMYDTVREDLGLERVKYDWEDKINDLRRRMTLFDDEIQMMYAKKRKKLVELGILTPNEVVSNEELDRLTERVTRCQL